RERVLAGELRQQLGRGIDDCRLAILIRGRRPANPSNRHPCLPPGAPSSLSFWEEAGKREVAGGAALAHPEPVPCRPEVGVKVKARELNSPRHVPHILQEVPGTGKGQSYPPPVPLSGGPRGRSRRHPCDHFEFGWASSRRSPAPGWRPV